LTHFGTGERVKYLENSILKLEKKAILCLCKIRISVLQNSFQLKFTEEKNGNVAIVCFKTGIAVVLLVQKRFFTF
jgi:hypothetical protein